MSRQNYGFPKTKKKKHYNFYGFCLYRKTLMTINFSSFELFSVDGKFVSLRMFHISFHTINRSIRWPRINQNQNQKEKKNEITKLMYSD